MDIYCKNGKCPICDDKLMDKFFGDRTCKNSCYSVESVDGYGDFNFRVFSNYFRIGICTTIEEADKNQETFKLIEQAILYYKENDRYVGEILGRVD
ncbi:MAG: hypothetical protein K0R18_524 [Bacillales bacterium]|jgi:hypothetical protein|nr:hypothetical protein [Bacillales bacterium]